MAGRSGLDAQLRVPRSKAAVMVALVVEEIIGRHFSVFYPPEAIAAGLPERLLATARAEGRTEHEGWRVHKDGSRFWASVVITALHDENGALRGYGKVTRDLTERHAAELARRAAEERCRAESTMARGITSAGPVRSRPSCHRSPSRLPRLGDTRVRRTRLDGARPVDPPLSRRPAARR